MNEKEFFKKHPGLTSMVKTNALCFCGNPGCDLIIDAIHHTQIDIQVVKTAIEECTNDYASIGLVIRPNELLESLGIENGKKNKTTTKTTC